MTGAPAPRAVCKSFPPAEFAEQARRFQGPGNWDPGDVLLAFARRAVTSAPARRVPGVLVVRGGPAPGVAVIGTFDDAALARVGELLDHLDEVLTDLRYVSYGQAERDVERLAEHLAGRYSAAELDEAAFQAIPRGGHIVLGMLALVMDLRHEQLLPVPQDPTRLTVMIDDCALSGHRARQTIERSGAERIALGVLYAPKELLRRIEDVERRVVSCVAAHHLRDLGSDWFGEGYASWQRRWTTSVSEDRYWVGRPQPAAFAWKEPDRSYVNRVTGDQEEGWKLLPPALCLAPAPAPSSILQVQHQQPGPGPLRVSDEVFFATIGERVVIAHAAADHALELDEVGSLIFGGLHAEGNVDAASARLQGAYELPTRRAVSDVEALTDQLLTLGVLTVDERPPPPGSRDTSPAPPAASGRGDEASTP